MTWVCPVQVLHQMSMSVPGQCPKSEQEESLVSQGSGLPWHPLARAEFTCCIRCDNQCPLLADINLCIRASNISKRKVSMELFPK